VRPITGVGLLLAVVAGTIFTQPAESAAGGTFALSSSAFGQGTEIPAKYACTGADSTPPLEWKDAPAHTASFALIMDDPDAPAGTWVHWVLWNLPPTAHALAEGVPKRDSLNDGTRQGQNSNHKTGYDGPCPPAGQTHRYFFRLYALDEMLQLSPNASRSDLDGAMKGHILAETEHVGTFHK